MTPRQAYSRAFIFSSSHTPRTRSRPAFRATSRKPASESSAPSTVAPRNPCNQPPRDRVEVSAVQHRQRGGLVRGCAEVVRDREGYASAPARRSATLTRRRVRRAGQICQGTATAFRDGFEFVGYAAQVIRREVGHRYMQGVVHADAVPRCGAHRIWQIKSQIRCPAERTKAALADSRFLHGLKKIPDRHGAGPDAVKV